MRFRAICSPLLVLGMLTLSAPAFAEAGVSIRIAPPELPLFAQPMCPGDGYLWTPEYWAWGESSYYLVPGAWVEAPEIGYLWTPGYWGWGDDGYFFNEGYWGESVGFYGGINYGFGYFGNGYQGGRWNHGHFFYNTAVNRVNAEKIHDVYNTRVRENSSSRVSYNGGHGGVTGRATAQEEASARSRHLSPVAAQTRDAESARNDPRQGFAAIHDSAAAGGSAARASAAVHPRDLSPVERPAAPNTGNSKQDEKYQKEQDKLVARQNQDRAKLQARQDNEHHQMMKRSEGEAGTRQVEQDISNRLSKCSKENRTRWGKCRKENPAEGLAAGVVVAVGNGGVR